MIISLIGFMGTGKSTVAEKLAEKINFQYRDTDNEIIVKTGMSVSEIFNKFGEVYFRDLERDILERITASREDIVLSTGGGIVLSPLNRNTLQEKTIPILLTSGAEEIYERIKGDAHRPLLEVEEPLDEIRILLEKRYEYYNEFDFRIDTEGLTVEEIVDIIIEKTGVRN